MATVAEVFALAVQHHQAGQLPQAEQLYLQILQADPGHADAHHLLGLLAYQAGRYHQAVASIRRALTLDPQAAVYHANLGVAREALGQLDEAVGCYQQALRLRPQDADSHYNLGNVLRRQQKLDEAKAHYRQALGLKADYAQAHCNFGLTLAAQGQLGEAVAHYQQALRLNPHSAPVHNNLGIALTEQGRLDEAVASFREALRLDPDFAQAHHGLGCALQRQDKLDEAIGCYRQALRLKPDYPEACTNLAEACNNLGGVLQRQDQYEEAIRYHQEALRLNPNFAEACNNLGSALQHQDKLDEAIGCYQQAVRLKPSYAEAWTHLANLHWEQSRFDEALACYAKAISCRADLADAHFNRSRLFLLLGDWGRGWPEYEWRWQTKAFPRQAFQQPRWDGSDLKGRTILVDAEQGLGDTLHFVRYLPLVKQRGGRVNFLCQPPLLPLLASVQAIDHLLSQGSQLPAFDVQTPLVSLPGIFHTSLAAFPAPVPYLHADAELVKHWKSRKSEVGSRKSEHLHLTSDIGHRTSDFLVGITWQGNPAFLHDRQRSIPLVHFAPLAQVEGVQLISLQKGAGTDQLKQLRIADCGLRIERQETKPLLESAIRNPQSAILDLGSRLDEASGAFMDTAAIMTHLDLVISSDTAVAHLAGALGIPVWVALPMAPDWRWLLGREDSPWYPTMRLFRQTRYGQWEDVFDRLAEELKAVVSCQKTNYCQLTHRQLTADN